MNYSRRKDAPRVRDGSVQFKNNHTLTRHWSQVPGDQLLIEREKPGPEYRHLLRKQDLERFVALLPEWEELSRGVDVLLLAKGKFNVMGYYDLGIVAVCAWDREIAGTYSSRFVDEHREVLARLDVPIGKAQHGYAELGFTEASARGFQLMHILLHELGHHHDRMTTESQARSARGEGYAERYANEHADATSGASTIEISGEDAGIQVLFDPLHLNQVVTNLVENAQRYSREASGTSWAHLEFHRHPRTLLPCLDVFDRGPGVDDNNVGQIFEPFFTTSHSGTGLGLYLAKEHCEFNYATLSYVKGATDEDDAPSSGFFRITFAHPDQLLPGKQHAQAHRPDR